MHAVRLRIVLLAGAALLAALVAISAVTRWQRAASNGYWGRYQNGGCFVGIAPGMTYDEKVVIFATPDSGQGDIIELNLESGVRRPLANAGVYEGFPCVTKHGTLIYSKADPESGACQLHQLEPGESKPKRLTASTDSDEEPCSDLSGTLIVFSRSQRDHSPRHSHIFSINRENGTLKQLTFGKANKDRSPAINADGSIIAFVRNADEIWIMDVDGNNSRFLCRGHSPKWAASAHRLAYIGDPSLKQRYDLFVLDVDTMSHTQITADGRYKWSPTFTFDDTRLIYVEDESCQGDGSIIQIGVDGTGRRVIADVRDRANR